VRTIRACHSQRSTRWRPASPAEGFWWGVVLLESAPPLFRVTLPALLDIGLKLRLERRQFCERRIAIWRFFPALEAGRLARLPIAFPRRTISLRPVKTLLRPVVALVPLMPSWSLVGIAGLLFDGLIRPPRCSSNWRLLGCVLLSGLAGVAMPEAWTPFAFWTPCPARPPDFDQFRFGGCC
jgi:hypothetical protein